MILTSLQIETSCLENTFILSVTLSQETTAGGSSPYNSRLGCQCPVVAKGSMTAKILLSINYVFMEQGILIIIYYQVQIF